MQERITETFRGLHCARHARQWRDRMAPQGWRMETFGGVSGIGGYKACSMTLIKALSPEPPDATLKAYQAVLESGLDPQWTDRVIKAILNADIRFQERAGNGQR